MVFNTVIFPLQGLQPLVQFQQLLAWSQDEVLVSSLSNGKSVCICTGFLMGCKLLALRGILGSEPGRL